MTPTTLSETRATVAPAEETVISTGAVAGGGYWGIRITVDSRHRRPWSGDT
jgi:hypothetical protein